MCASEYSHADHFSALYSEAQRRIRSGLLVAARRGGSALEDAQRGARRELESALGLPVIRDRASNHRVEAEEVERVELEDHVRELVRVHAEPGVRLPTYILTPRGTPPESGFPLVLAPHGHSEPDIYVGISHSEEQKQEIEESEGDVARQAVREGYIAVAPISRGFGETRTAEAKESGALSSCRELLMHNLLVGRTPIGDRVWDLLQLLEWSLDTRPVDPGRIAVVGQSGGGTTALYAAACEERIGLCIPSCSFCTFTGSIGSIHHCACNYVPGILRFAEMADLAGLITPRPLHVVTGKRDEIFPIDEVRRAHREALEFWSALGTEERCTLYEGDGGHRFYRDGAWPTAARYLAGASK